MELTTGYYTSFKTLIKVPLFIVFTLSYFSSIAQNVGINNNNPQHSLDVGGTCHADTLLVSGNNSFFRMYNTDYTSYLWIDTDYSALGFQYAGVLFRENSYPYGALEMGESFSGRALQLKSVNRLVLEGRRSQGPGPNLRIVLGSTQPNGDDGIYVARAQFPLGLPRALFDIRGSMACDTAETTLLNLSQTSSLPSLQDVGLMYMDDGSNTGGVKAPRWYDGSKWNTFNDVSSIQDADKDSKITIIEGPEDELIIDLDGGEVLSLKNQANGKTSIDAANSEVTIASNSVTGSPQLRLKETNTGYTRLYFENTNSDIIALTAQPGTTPNASIANFFLGGSDILSMRGSGRVGINDSSPAAGLEINAEANDDAFIVRTGSTTHLNIDDMGVTTINNQLIVDDLLTIGDQYTLPTNYSNFSTLKSSVSGSTYWGRTLWTEGTNNRVFNTTDDIGIGNGAPVYKLDIEDSNQAGPVTRIRNDQNDNKIDGLLIELNTTSNPTSDSKFVVCADGTGNNLGAIVGDGAGGIQLVQLSDQRLKEDIRVFTGGLEMIEKLNAYSYNMKVAPDEDRIGFIAQELYEVFPQMVTGNPENTSESNPMMVNYAAITPILLSAIKDLASENKELKNKLKSTDDRLVNIEALLLKIHSVSNE